jgi:pilus assembly protein CpaB
VLRIQFRLLGADGRIAPQPGLNPSRLNEEIVSSRRTLVVIAAVVIGAIASFALFQYTASVKDEAYGNARRVEVLVVTKDIPKGMLGADVIRDGYVGTVLIPQEIRPATALVSSAGLESLVARSELAANQVVVDQMFVTPEQAYASSSERIEEGMVAITISVDQVHGVAGLVVPGDRVDMIIGRPAGEVAPGVEGEQGQEGAPSEANGSTTMLFQNVRVFAIGSQLTPDLGETATDAEVAAQAASAASNLMTFVVPPAAALKLAHVPSELVYLALVPPDNAPVPLAPATDQNLLDGGLTPYPDEEGL